MSLSIEVFPLLSSSMTLFYAWAEVTTVILPFLRSAEPIPDRSIRLYWDVFFPYGGSTILALAVASTASGILAARNVPAGCDAQKLFYAGTAFALGHFVFGPSIMPVIGRIRDEGTEKKGETKKEIRAWLRIHAWRTALADLPAVVCFAMGFWLNIK